MPPFPGKRLFPYGLWILLFVLFSVSSCQKAAVMQPTATAIPIPTVILQATATEIQNQDELYFLLRSSSDRKYQWARLPANCVIGKQVCPATEFIPGFPENEYANMSPDPVSWSPDGNLAIFYNSNTTSLHTYDPQAKFFRVISQNLPLQRDTILWSPDSKGAIMIKQGAEPETNNTVLLYHPNANTTQEIMNGPYGIKIPLGWKSNTEVIWLIENLPSKADLKNGGSDTGRMGFYQQDVSNNQWQEIANITNWNSDYAAMSPNHQFVAFMTLKDNKSCITLFDLTNKTFRDLGFFGVAPIWSPDSKWLVTYLQNGGEYDIYLIDPSDGKSATIGKFGAAPTIISWLSDSKHLFVQLDEQIGNQLVLSIIDGTYQVFEFPGLPIHAYSVAGLSTRWTSH